jgi:hypothetical protein
MLIEVIFYDRIGNYSNGQIAEIEDGPFLRALLKGGKADVINPPDWSPEKADALVETKKSEINTSEKTKLHSQSEVSKKPETSKKITENMNSVSANSETYIMNKEN